MVIRVAADLRCGNKIRHATAGFPLAVAIFNDPMVGPRSWFLRCDGCVDALKLSDDPDPYLVAFLHGHDPTADPRPDPPPTTQTPPTASATTPTAPEPTGGQP